VGNDTAIVIGEDGLALISYHDVGNADLKVAHCEDLACTTATITTLDSAGNVGSGSSIAIGRDGLGFISYYDAANGDLKIAHCSNTPCTSAQPLSLTVNGDVGRFSSVAIGADGLPLIGYYDATNGDLKVAHCSSVTCNNAFVSTVDSAGEVGESVSVLMGVDGRGVLAYGDRTNDDIRVARCRTTLCDVSDAMSLTTQEGPRFGRHVDIVLPDSGVPLVFGYDHSVRDLVAVNCERIDCEDDATSWVVPSRVDGWNSDVGEYAAAALGPGGRQAVAYRNATGGNLQYSLCSSGCGGGRGNATVDDGTNLGLGIAMAFGIDGLPLVSYYDAANGDLKVAHLSSVRGHAHARYR
jgi:hypothetical protein